MHFLENLSKRFGFGKRGSSAVNSRCEPWSSIFGEIAVREYLAKQPDLRFLAQELSASQGCDQWLSIERVASMCDMLILRRLPALDVSEIVEQISLAEFRAAGAAPLMHEGYFSGCVCCNPMLIAALQERLFQLGHSPRWYVSSWLEIARALDASEKRLISMIDENRLASRRTLHDLARKVVEKIVAQATEYGAMRVTIEREDENCIFRFLAANGLQGKGEISAQMKEPLWTLLQRGASSKEAPAFLFREDPMLSPLEIVSTPDHSQFELLLHHMDRSAPVNMFQLPGTSENLKGNTGIEASHRVAPPIEKHEATLEVVDSGKKILLIEDNATFAKVLERFLTRHEVNTTSVQSAEDALDLLASGSNRFDAVVCDFHLPGMNGVAFSQRLRADARWYRLPLLILTSMQDVELQINALAEGADAFISKQSDPRLLLVYIERLISRSRQLRKAA